MCEPDFHRGVFAYCSEEGDHITAMSRRTPVEVSSTHIC